MEAGEIEKPLHHVAPRRKLLELLSLKVASDTTPENGILFGLLQQLFQQNGCEVVARGSPRELSGIEWLIIGKY